VVVHPVQHRAHRVIKHHGHRHHHRHHHGHCHRG
jgi:hypothetical protein